MEEYNTEDYYLKHKNDNCNKFNLGEIVRWNTYPEKGKR